MVTFLDNALYISTVIILVFFIYFLIRTRKNLNENLERSERNMNIDFEDFLEYKESFNFNFHGTLQFKDKYENLLEYYLTMPWLTLNKRELYFKTEEKNNNISELYEYIIYTMAAFALIFSIVSFSKIAVLPFSLLILITIIFLSLYFSFNSKHKRDKASMIDIHLLYITKAIELRTTTELTKAQLNQYLSDV